MLRKIKTKYERRKFKYHKSYCAFCLQRVGMVKIKLGGGWQNLKINGVVNVFNDMKEICYLD